MDPLSPSHPHPTQQHVCCICDAAFGSSTQLTTHQSRCLNTTPLSELAARINKTPLPVFPPPLPLEPMRYSPEPPRIPAEPPAVLTMPANSQTPRPKQAPPLQPFPVCNPCRRAFLSQDALEYHVRESPRHRGGGGGASTGAKLKPIRCRLCRGGKEYADDNALAVHLREAHRALIGLPNKKKEQPQALNPMAPSFVAPPPLQQTDDFGELVRRARSGAALAKERAMDGGKKHGSDTFATPNQLAFLAERQETKKARKKEPDSASYLALAASERSDVAASDESMELVPASIASAPGKRDKNAKIREIFTPLLNVADIQWEMIDYKGNSWSIVPRELVNIYLNTLSQLCLTPEELLSNNFTLEPYTQDYLKFMQKCYTCRNNSQVPECAIHPGGLIKVYNNETRKLDRIYSCCQTINRPGRKTGCTVLPSHNFESFTELSSQWDFSHTPAPAPNKAKHKVVAIDCEMGGTFFGRSELILVTAVDFFTGEVLINSLVKPAVQIVDWRTKYSGVSEGWMRKCVTEGDCLDGWKHARAELCKFIDADTVLVGHSLHNDLDQLRLLHHRVVDAFTLIPRHMGQKHGVKGLSEVLLGRNVQRNNKSGHDCLEDTLAARELVLWCLKKPADFVARMDQSAAEQEQYEAEIRLPEIQKTEERVQSKKEHDRKARVEPEKQKGALDAEQRRLLQLLLDSGITLADTQEFIKQNEALAM